jgi:tRNA 2-thiouridine synthesizing protein C
MLLFIFTHSPYAGTLTQEGIDALLAAAAFDTKVSALFIEDGVWSLLNKQAPEKLEQKNISKVLQVLPLYDVNELYCCQQSLDSRNLGSQITENVTILNDDEIKNLISKAHQVLSF